MSESKQPSAFVREAPEDDRFHDQCGLFGVFGHPEAAHLTYMGLYALQHRGQESAGIATGDGKRLRVEKGMGLVNDVFSEEVLGRLEGDRAIGHVRYSTAGDAVATNAQPYLIDCHRGPIAVGHNGNLVNAAILRQELEAAGSIFQSTSDTEVILHLYARNHRERLEDAELTDALGKILQGIRIEIGARLVRVRLDLGYFDEEDALAFGVDRISHRIRYQRTEPLAQTKKFLRH